MAGGALGALTVKLSLDSAEFTGGLNKADFAAQQFARNVGQVIGQGIQLAVTSFAAFTTAGTAAFIAADKLIKQAGDYQDMAEKINGNAEAIASFGVALGTAGTSAEVLVGASIRLTKGLTGVDDESKAAGAAIAALGLNLADFKKLQPEQQLETVAKAMAGFADTTDKTAIAVALFGKSGAELLPFLKALEEQGGRQVILTAEQIAQADEYADKVARVTAEFTQQAQAAATQLIPTLSDAFDVVTQLAKAFAESESTVTLFKVAIAAVLIPLQTIAVLGANVGFVFLGVGREIGAVAAQLAALARGDITGFRAISDAVKEDGARARAELDAFEKRVMSVGQRAPLDDEARRRLGRGPSAAGLPSLNFAGADAAAKKAASAAKSTLADAERYIEALRKQDEKTQELSATEKVLGDIQAGRFVASGKFSEEEALRLAKRIDLMKEEEFRIKAGRDAAIEAGDAVTKANEARQASLQRLAAATPSAKLEKDRADAQLLTEEFEAGRISEEKYIETLTSRFDLNAEKLKETKTLAEEIGPTFTSAFEDAIVSGGKFSDVIKSLGQDILKLIIRKSVTEPILNAIGGANIFGSLFGGGKAAGGPVDAGRLYRVNENGPEMLDVNGSQYLMMGSKGGTVRPGSSGSGGGGSLVVNVGAGASRAEVIAAVQQGVATSVGMVAESNRRRGSI